jgi:hypothetical protein
VKTLGTAIVLACALTLSTAALAQLRVGGHGAAGAPPGGGYGSRTNAAGTGRVDPGANRHQPHFGAGSFGRFSVGIGSSRVNSAISSQGRGHRGGRPR